jgi:hypothetical protein
MELRLIQPATNSYKVYSGMRVLHPPKEAPGPPSAGSGPVRAFAVVAPYRSGWKIHGLNQGVPVRHNGTPLRGGADLSVGDQVQLGSTPPWIVDIAVLDAPPQPSPAGLLPCIITLRVNGEQFHEEIAAEEIIGTLAGVGVRLPESSGLGSLHALLVPADGGWYLHDLSGQGLRRAEQTCQTLCLVEQTSVWLGAVELAFRLKVQPPLQPDLEAANPPDVPDAGAPAPPAAVDTTHGVRQPETRVSVASPAELEVLPVSQQANPVYARGRRLCGWLQEWLQAGMPTASGAAGLGEMLRGWRGGASRYRDPLAALAQFEQDLAGAPSNRALLLDLARFFEEHRLYDLTRFVLKEVHRLDPEDAGVLRSVAEVCLKQARLADLPLPLVLDAYRTAERYITRALARLPRDVELAALLETVQVEKTIREGGYDTLTPEARPGPTEGQR